MPQPTSVALFAAKSTDKLSCSILTLATRICEKDRKMSTGAIIVISFSALVNQGQNVDIPTFNNF